MNQPRRPGGPPPIQHPHQRPQQPPQVGQNAAVPRRPEPFPQGVLGGGRLGGPGRAYHTGIKQPVVASTGVEDPDSGEILPDFKRAFQWCLPLFYRQHDLGAQSVFVTLGVSRPSGSVVSTTDDFSDLSARIVFGSGEECGGDDPYVEVDCADGTAIDVIAYSLEVYLGWPRRESLDITQPPIDVTISVGIGASGRIARRSVRIGTVGPAGTSASFRTPRFAHSAVMTNATLAVPALTLVQQSEVNGTIIGIGPVGKLDEDAVVLNPGIRAFAIGNPGANAAVNVRAVFDLKPFGS
jgi:hypothetical protein